MTSYYQLTPAQYKTHTLEEAKLQTRVDGSDEDSLIEALISAADQIAENKTNRAFMQSVYVTVSTCWQTDFVLWPAPLVTVAHVKYYDSDNALQTLDPSNYIVYSSFLPGILSTSPATNLPSVYDRKDAIQITYTVGVGSSGDDESTQRSKVPESVRTWIKLNLATLYEHRQLFTEGSMGNINTLADSLIYPYIL